MVCIPQLNAGTILAFYRLVKWEINLYWKIEERIGGGGWVWKRQGSGSLNQQPSLPCIPGHPFQPHPSPTKVTPSFWFSSSDEYSQFWFVGKKFTLQVSNTNVLIYFSTFPLLPPKKALANLSLLNKYIKLVYRTGLGLQGWGVKEVAVITDPLGVTTIIL